MIEEVVNNNKDNTQTQENITEQTTKREDYTKWEVKATAEVAKGVQAQILVSPQYEEYLDIRRYFKGKPTKKGIRVNLTNIKNLINS